MTTDVNETEEWERFNEEMDRSEKEVPLHVVEDEIRSMITMCEIFGNKVAANVLIELMHNIQDRAAKHGNT
jgi:hypothetical protein